MRLKNLSQKLPSRTLTTLSLVVLLHLVLAILVNYSFTIKTVAPIPPQPIKASLLFPSKINDEQEDPEAVAPPKEEINQDNLIQEKVFSEVTNQPDTKTNTTDNKEVTLEDLPIAAENQPTSERAVIDVRNLTQNGLNKLRSHALKRTTEDAIRDYRQSRNTIKRPSPPNLALSEDEKFRKARAIPVDCQSTGKKVLAFVSSIAGGTITCQNEAAFEEYIKRHLPGGRDVDNNGSENDQPH